MLALVLSIAMAQEPPVPPPPIPAPAAVDGCVSREAVDAYQAALDARAEKALVEALGPDVKLETREGFWIDEIKEIDAVYSVDDKRFAYLGPRDARGAPQERLARKGDTLHRLVPEPTAWEFDLVVCGANPCPTGGGGARVPLRGLVIELRPTEQVGPPLTPEHDSWWVLQSYTASRHCLPTP